MYTLDFATIRRVMQAHRKTGFLQAEIPSAGATLQEHCSVEIKIAEGALVSCLIVGKSGRYITGEEAIAALSRLGRLTWFFTPQQRTDTQPIAVLPQHLQQIDTQLIPRRIAYVDQEQMNTWPRLHRRVFVLADGSKSIAKIAGILSMSPEVIVQTINDLQSIGVMEMP